MYLYSSISDINVKNYNQQLNESFLSVTTDGFAIVEIIIISDIA